MNALQLRPRFRDIRKSNLGGPKLNLIWLGLESVLPQAYNGKGLSNFFWRDGLGTCFDGKGQNESLKTERLSISLEF